MIQASRRQDGTGIPERGPVLVTLDVDWAPDWMIEAVALRLVKAGVKATWFATHDSPAMRQLRREPLFEIGLHPNFLPGSSHGATPDAVFGTLRGWFPDATTCRTHSLVMSEPLLAQMACRFGMKIDCSVHLPRAAHVVPHELHLSERGDSLIRLPHVFQDNMHAMSRRDWTPAGAGLGTPGWKVLNFHPVHIILNSADLRPYEALKGCGPLSAITRADLPSIGMDGPGAGTFFDAVLAALGGQPSFTVQERVSLWSDEERS